MIKSIEVEGLNGEFDFSFKFHPDLNLLTGKNGVGKTTLLKLIYYIISGNLEKLVPEIPFSSVILVTSEYTIDIKIVGASADAKVAEIKWKIGDQDRSITVRCKDFVDNSEKLHSADFSIASASEGSIFFPTFRRIEGGFTIQEGQTTRRHPSASAALQNSLNELAQTLTFLTHSFVASISTDDIETLLTLRYADTSKRAIKLQTDLSSVIETEIKDFNDSEAYAEDKENLQKARRILTEIQHKVRDLESARTLLFKPFETLNNLIRELMHNKGIKVKEITTFGDIKRAIDATKLSAGEKQMLSFLCYNAFANNTVILIDEPEISLHVDWQRVLFSKLLEQGSNNQFIVTTHSPFIYSKYPEKEIVLDVDRGYADV